VQSESMGSMLAGQSFIGRCKVAEVGRKQEVMKGEGCILDAFFFAIMGWVHWNCFFSLCFSAGLVESSGGFRLYLVL